MGLVEQSVKQFSVFSCQSVEFWWIKSIIDTQTTELSLRPTLMGMAKRKFHCRYGFYHWRERNETFVTIFNHFEDIEIKFHAKNISSNEIKLAGEMFQQNIFYVALQNLSVIDVDVGVMFFSSRFIVPTTK